VEKLVDVGQGKKQVMEAEFETKNYALLVPYLLATNQAFPGTIS